MTVRSPALDDLAVGAAEDLDPKKPRVGGSPITEAVGAAGNEVLVMRSSSAW